jgi:hypothetical protein
MVIFADCELEPMLAVMARVSELATPFVVMVNVAVVEPAATVTVEGTCASDPLLVRLTTVPVPVAVWEIVTVPVLELPPTTEIGESVRDVTRVLPATCATNPDQIIGPHPETVSQPTVASEVEPLGRVPLVPSVTS